MKPKISQLKFRTLPALLTLVVALFFLDWGGKTLGHWMLMVELRGTVPETWSVSELFGYDRPIASIVSVVDIPHVTTPSMEVEEAFEAAIEWLDQPPPVDAKLFKMGYRGAGLEYFLYPVEVCGQNVCPFDPRLIEETDEESLFSMREASLQRVTVRKRKLILYEFEVNYTLGINRNGEAQYGLVYTVDPPRNFIETALRKLSNYRPPFRRAQGVFKYYAPLDKLHYFGPGHD